MSIPDYEDAMSRLSLFIDLNSIGPATSEAWASLMALYPDGPGLSREEATRVIQAERDNLDLAESIIKKERLNVDFWRGNLCESKGSLLMYSELSR